MSDAPASLHFVSEPSLKLGIDSSATRNFSQHFVTNAHQRQVLIRPSLTGSNAYPLISTPLDSGQTTRNIVRGAKSLCRWLGTSELTYNTKINNLARSGEPSLRAEFGDYFLLEPIAMRMPSLGPVQLNKIYAPSSPWQYFEIYSFGDLLKMRNGQQITMRVDSGCDSGMLYHDYGCDCHAQLISALTWAQQDNGFVLHCPTQDGRGYGMNTKMETEAHKLGVPNVFNAGMPPMKTLEAAKRMLGDDHYDIRTFDGIGQMLGTMGFRNLRMITDNKHKVDQVSSGHRDLQVIRVRTGTSDQQAHCQHHVEEKRMSEDYYTV
ncbi:MAG: hypothetical protein KBC53_10940 [Nitrosomonas sp.]|nr:hypothetical protein [Nitrosomonas sp.]